MNLFTARQSGDSASGTGWPAHAPALRLLEVPARLQVPLSVRASTDPIAHKPAGTLVAKGERLCALGAPGSPAALAPTSGRIVGASQAQLLNGSIVPAVDIEADFEDRPLPGQFHDALHAQDQHEHLEDLATAGSQDLAAWIDRLRDAGVWAERPGSPDLLDQLHHALRQPVDTLICNLLDDEPTMRLNSTLAARSGPTLLAGVGLMAKLTEARRVCLVVEAGSPGRWWTPLRRLVRKTNVEVVPIVNDYPQGEATMLLLSVLKRRLKPGRSPIDQKVLLFDAAAAISVGRSVVRERPMLQVPLAVRDHRHLRTHFLVVPVGMSLRQVLQQCDISVDGMILRRGAVLRENEIPLDAVVSGGDLTVHVMPRQSTPLPDPCIRCSWCVESCPVGVQPAGLLEAAQRADPELARAYGLDSCIECGVCSYMCPSRLPLLAGIRTLRSPRSENPVPSPPVLRGI
jgi:electron transport complex protein RnfC